MFNSIIARLILCLLSVCLIQPLWSESTLTPKAKLQMVEVKQRQAQTILIFTLQKSTTPNFFTLDNPNRFVMDLPQTQASSVLPKDIKTNGLIAHIRLGSGPQGPGNLRLVMDLAVPISYFTLLDQDEKKQQQMITVILNKTGEAPQKPVA